MFRVPGSWVPCSMFRVRWNVEAGTWNSRTRNLEPGTRNVTINVHAIAVRSHRDQAQDVLRVRGGAVSLPRRRGVQADRPGRADAGPAENAEPADPCGVRQDLQGRG